MNNKALLLIVIILFCSSVYGEHQVGMYLSPNYSKVLLNNYETKYNNFSVTTGILYRYNQDILNHFLSFTSMLGGGFIFSELENSEKLLDYNSFLELDFGVSYGYKFGLKREHQVTFLGVSVLPKFYGLLEKNSYAEIGGTEVEWYQGFYMPLSIGIHLPSYRYSEDGFFMGFQHQITFLVYGNENMNVPDKNLLLNGIGYTLRWEIGFSLSKDRNKEKNKEYVNIITETSLIIRTNNNVITLSFIGNMDDAEQATIEMFAVKDTNSVETRNLIAYGGNLPVFNGRVQFTKHWQNNKNYFDEDLEYEPKYIVVRYKKVKRDGSVLKELELVQKITK